MMCESPFISYLLRFLLPLFFFWLFFLLRIYLTDFPAKISSLSVYFHRSFNTDICWDLDSQFKDSKVFTDQEVFFSWCKILTIISESLTVKKISNRNWQKNTRHRVTSSTWFRLTSEMYLLVVRVRDFVKESSASRTLNIHKSFQYNLVRLWIFWRSCIFSDDDQ